MKVPDIREGHRDDEPPDSTPRQFPSAPAVTVLGLGDNHTAIVMLGERWMCAMNTFWMFETEREYDREVPLGLNVKVAEPVAAVETPGAATRFAVKVEPEAPEAARAGEAGETWPAANACTANIEKRNSANGATIAILCLARRVGCASIIS